MNSVLILPHENRLTICLFGYVLAVYARVLIFAHAQTKFDGT